MRRQTKSHPHVSQFSLLLMVLLLFAVHSLGAGSNLPSGSFRSTLSRGLFTATSFASEENSGSAEKGESSQGSAAHVAESKEGESGEAERTVKYSVFQDICSLIAAIIIIFSVYWVIKKRAERPSA